MSFRRQIALALLTLLAVAAPATARPHRAQPVLRPRFTHLRGAQFIVGGGDVYVSGGSIPAGSGVLINGATGRRTTVTEPNCQADAMGGGSIVFTCPIGSSSFKVYDIRTRRIAPLVLASRIDPGNCNPVNGDADECIPDGIGAHWVSVEDACFEHCNADIFQNLFTGAVKGDISTRTRALDLDSPSLTTPLCRPITDPAIPVVGVGPNKYAREPVTLDGRFALVDSAPNGTTFLEHCGTRLHDKIPIGLNADNAHAVVWTSGIELAGVMLPSLRRFRIVVPDKANPWTVEESGFTELALTAHTLFLAGRGLWTATMPRLPSR